MKYCISEGNRDSASKICCFSDSQAPNRWSPQHPKNKLEIGQQARFCPSEREKKELCTHIDTSFPALASGFFSLYEVAQATFTEIGLESILRSHFSNLRYCIEN